MAIKAKGSLTSQSLWLLATNFLSMLTTVLFARSTWPDDWGWWLMWNVAFTPNASHTSCMTWAVKCVPLSESTLAGRPKREKTWFMRRQAVVSAVSFGAGRRSTHFVKAQVTVRKYLFPRVDLVRGPTQSIWRSDHGKEMPLRCRGALWSGLDG